MKCPYISLIIQLNISLHTDDEHIQSVDRHTFCLHELTLVKTKNNVDENTARICSVTGEILTHDRSDSNFGNGILMSVDDAIYV